MQHARVVHVSWFLLRGVSLSRLARRAGHRDMGPFDLADDFEEAALGVAKSRRFFQRQKRMTFGAQKIASLLQDARQPEMNLGRIDWVELQQRLVAGSREG